jgi:uncharacterized repeat protein (TIGR01451 family)
MLSAVSGLLLFIAGGLATPAAAQTVIPATNNLSCLGARHGTTMNCTANDFTVAATFNAASGTPAYCTAGTAFTFNAILDVTSSNSQRYDVGFFVGQQSNLPEAPTAGNICTVATFPKSPSPFVDIGGNACGDFASSSEAFPTVTGIKVVCAASSGSTLTIPYVLSYNQSSSTCTGPSDVMAGSKSKCSSNAATLNITSQTASAPVLVGGYVDVTKVTDPVDPTAGGQSFTYTASAVGTTQVGVEKGGTSINNFLDGNTANDNTATFTLANGETARVYMAVIPTTTRTVTITETGSTHWEGSATISCVAADGSPVFNANGATRTITANLNTVNRGVACTITNKKRARVSLVERVEGRLFSNDQFQLTASGAGASTLTDNTSGAAITAGSVTVTTSGTSAPQNYTSASHASFRATPGQSLTLATAMAGGSTSPASRYVTTLTCTNASTATGRTTSLPSNQVTGSYSFTPKPDDDITCTYKHTPLALITLSKVVVNDDGLTHAASEWTLTANGPSYITGAAGSTAVTSATVAPGTYALSESGPPGYNQTSLVCTGGADTDLSNDLAIAAGEIITCTFTNNDTQVGQTLVKSDASLDQDADGSGTITEGDRLAYAVTMTNIGITTLTGVRVSDSQLTPSSKSCSSVASGETCVLNGTHVVTAGEATAGQVVNTASVTSNEVTTPLSSNTVTTTVVPRPAPALQVTKSHSGDFYAASTATYTLQVRNVGYGTVPGTTTVTDTLDPDLHFVSASGTNWACGVTGSPETVTCTSSAGVASFADMAPITLTVLVDGAAGTSVDNAASVANTTLNGGTPVAGNTDTATIVHPDLSTSSKGVVNLGGGSTADVDQGDVLQYTIYLKETAGAAAAGVQVTDAIASGLGSLTVTSLPSGASDHSTGSLLDIRDITVPAGTVAQIVFRVTVGAGFSPGNPIDNTAHIDNPGGPDADPDAPTLTYEISQVTSDDEKILYLHSTGGATTLDRIIHAGIDTTGTGVGTSRDWNLSAALAAPLTLTAGVIDVQLSMQDFGTVYVALYDGATQIGSNSASQNINAGSPEVHLFQVSLGSDYTLQAGHTLTLRVFGNVTVFDYNVGPSIVSFATSTVVHVDSVDAYDATYSGGSIPDAFFPGDTAYVRVVASDPFGGTDVSVSDSTITVTDPFGATIVGPIAMAMKATSGATRTLEKVVAIPADGPLGVWQVTVTAYEGAEHTIHHTKSANFEVRGHVTLDQAWGAGAITGDAVALQITGGSDAVDGSSTAPDAAVPATAASAGGATITLVQSFTNGSAGAYTVKLACVRDADGVALAVSGTGSSRQMQMPLDSSVTCTWTDTATTPLSMLKLVAVYSDPYNGTSNPKAIPGSIIEYQFIVSNPGQDVDVDSVMVRDPLPLESEFSIADINGIGSGPVRFIDGTHSSGLTYAYPADIEFSNDGGSTWDYVPSDPDGDGIDPEITDILINPKGVFNGNTTGNPTNDAQFTLKFRVRLK